MCAVAALMYLAHAIAGKPSRHLTSTISRIVDAQEQILERRTVTMPAVAEFFGDPPYVSLMARGADLATAYQGAQMFKEVARLAAEPTSAAQFRHGPIEILNPAHRYVLFARKGKTGAFVLKLAEDIQSHGGRVLLLTDLPFEDRANTRVIPVEPIALGLGTLVDIVHVQLLAHAIALRARPEPCEFWIAERVTREE